MSEKRSFLEWKNEAISLIYSILNKLEEDEQCLEMLLRIISQTRPETLHDTLRDIHLLSTTIKELKNIIPSHSEVDEWLKEEK